ncbi:hypothetical protein SAMN02910298_00237 [Pseudobutyrivibrio sp. YE44]|nr:hypothetical protein SAMN02910298_00237 [Pseudobutyrivibrio sp. YE44]
MPIFVNFLVLKWRKDMISTVNSTELRSEDVISDNLYHYDSKDKVKEVPKKELKTKTKARGGEAL